MSTEERVKRGQFTFKVFQLREGGSWYAGAEGSKGATKSAAIAAHMKVARADMREFDKRNKAATTTANAKRAKRAGKECTLTYCSGALNTPAHRRSAKHRNAVAVDNARHSGNRF